VAIKADFALIFFIYRHIEKAAAQRVINAQRKEGRDETS
jgi:hypothetical protein